jgi:hypothetical protein
MGAQKTRMLIKMQTEGLAWWLKPIILTIWGQRLGESQFKAIRSKKVLRHPSQPVESWVWWYMPAIPAVFEA